MIRIGDRVKFISDTYVGEVVKINGLVAEVAVEDGFVVPTMLSDLVVVNKEDEIDAMRRMGGPDNKPGTNKGSKQKLEKKAPPKREAAYMKYGKVSLVEDAEDDEDIINISELKALYSKSFANINAKEVEIFEKENPRVEIKEVEPVVEEIIEETVEETTVTPKEKMKAVSLDTLDKALNVKVEKANPKTHKPAKASDIEVIDLHAEEILDSTAGMTSGEILQTQLSRFNIALSLNVNSGKHGKMVFIHGVGSGKLKYELQKELTRKYPKIAYQDASFKEYGYGAIMIFY